MSSINDFIIKDGVLKKYVGPGGNVVIPDDVTEIGSDAFAGNKELTGVVVPDRVDYIFGGAFSGAFRDCSNLRSLTVPDNGIYIGDDAFKGCTGLADENGLIIVNGKLFECYSSNGYVAIPEGVTQIGGTFYENDSVRQVILPNSMGYCNNPITFYGCSKLEVVYIPEGIRWIKAHSFAKCGRLKELHLPDSVEGMDINALDGCHSLSFVTGSNVMQIVEQKSENPLCNRGGVPIMVCPKMPLRDVYKNALKNSLTLGFFMNQELFAAEIAEEYKKYAFRSRIYLLPDIFHRDLVQALAFYDQNKKIKPKDFEKEWLEPAQNAGATKCISWLLDWRSRHSPRKDPFAFDL